MFFRWLALQSSNATEIDDTIEDDPTFADDTTSLAPTDDTTSAIVDDTTSTLVDDTTSIAPTDDTTSAIVDDTTSEIAPDDTMPDGISTADDTLIVDNDFDAKTLDLEDFDNYYYAVDASNFNGALRITGSDDDNIIRAARSTADSAMIS